MNEESNSIRDTAPTEPESPMLDPELIRRIASMLAGASATADTTAGKDTVQENSKAEASNAAGDVLSTFLSDPALLQRLPQILSMMKPLLGSIPSGSPPTNASAPTAKGTTDNNRDRLLLSLKPFLSPTRCEAIDTMLRIARLGELFGQLK